MPELTEKELREIAEEAQLKWDTLAEYSRLTDIIGHMQANIERMEREETTEEPALDFRSPENAGKAQYQIDHTISDEHIAKRDALERKHPKFFEVEVEGEGLEKKVV